MEKFVISGERKISHQDILQNAAKAARGLEEECGISVADSVAIFMRNDFAFLKCLWPPLHWVLTQCR